MCCTCPSLCLSCCTTKPRCWGRIMQAASEWQKSRWFYAQSGWQTREASPWWTTRAKPWWRTVSTSKVSMWTCCHLTAAGHAPASHVQSSASGFGWSAPVFSHSCCNIGKNLESFHQLLCVLLVFPDHQTFLRPTEGENLKIKLYQHYSNVNVVYKPKSDSQDRVVISHGVLEEPLDPQLDGRLTVEGSEIILKKVNTADTGIFKVTDLAGFPVAHIYITVECKDKKKCVYSILSNVWRGAVAPPHEVWLLGWNSFLNPFLVQCYSQSRTSRYDISVNPDMPLCSPGGKGGQGDRFA